MKKKWSKWDKQAYAIKKQKEREDKLKDVGVTTYIDKAGRTRDIKH